MPFHTLKAMLCVVWMEQPRNVLWLLIGIIIKCSHFNGRRITIMMMKQSLSFLCFYWHQLFVLFLCRLYSSKNANFSIAVKKVSVRKTKTKIDTKTFYPVSTDFLCKPITCLCFVILAGKDRVNSMLFLLFSGQSFYVVNISPYSFQSVFKHFPIIDADILIL